ncbi:MAG: SIS domain-containing protein [Bacteroidota bacterium]
MASTRHEKIKDLAIKTLRIEAKAVEQLCDRIDDGFVRSIQWILQSKGRVVVSGVGKSAIIGQKIVATLNSTGTPSIFMHAADAIHGDLGIVQKDDIIICISKSGDTPEIKVLVPLIRNWGNKLIAMTGNPDSFLGRQSDAVLDTWVAKEACPNNLAPTSSSTAQLAMGDALAVCLLEARGFSSKDFAKYHPGGSLGKRLYLKVRDIFPSNAAPKVTPTTDLKKVILEITSNRLGAAAVVDKNRVVGIVTDGDLRRMLLENRSIEGLKASDIMTRKPKSAEKDMLAIDALALMKQHNISQLIITDKQKYVGMVHLHDLVKEGIL